MKSQKKSAFVIIVMLVALSIVASYLHRFLVVDRALDRSVNLPVVTDIVIPATGPITQLVKN